jgi:Ca2+-binding RTX toxin-like protein
MSNQTQVYLDNANLSNAAYANLKKETCAQDRIDNVNALENNSLFTHDLAVNFLDRYQILDVLSDTASGAFAVLVRDNNTGEATVSIRGTNDVVDWMVSDPLIAIPTLTQLLTAGQYMAVKDFYDNAVTQGDIGDNETITVTGHSLGGFLGKCFALLNPDVVGNAYAYNAPGFGGLVLEIMTTMGMMPDNLPYDKITNIYGSQFPSLIAGYGFDIGNVVEIPGRLHGIQSMIDELSKPGAYYSADNKLHWGPFDFITGIIDRFLQAAGYISPPPRRDPLILDLDGGGVETTAVTAGAYFDHDGNGFAEQTGWASADDGVLVLDRNGDGIINDGKELFGDQTILADGQKATNGFQTLAELDGNHDGKIDANDNAYSQLRVWQDEDGDGYSTADELKTLSELGVASISTASTITNITDPQGNTQTRIGSFTKTDGTTSTIANYSLRRDTTYTIANQWLDLPEDIAVLPDLQGYGNVYDLHQAMVRDTTGQLTSLVEQFTAATEINARNALMEQILFKWTGSDGIAADSRGANIDARKLATMEAFFGQAFVSQSGSNPLVGAAVFLNEAYRGLFEMTYAQLMSQTHLKDIYNEITYTWDEAAQNVKADLTSVITDLQNRIVADPASGQADLGEFARTLRGYGAQSITDYLSFREAFIMQYASLGWVIDSAGLPVIDSSGTGTLTGTDSSETLRGSLTLGNGVLTGLGGNDVIYGTDRKETLQSGSGNSILVSGGGDDTLWAGAGNDILDAGPGNDTLYGEAGNDTYIFRRGSGQDTVIDTDATAGNSDTIWLGSNLVSSDITLRRFDNNLILTINGTTDRMTVRDYFKNDSSINRIERVEFMDGTVWTDSDILQQTLSPTEGDDVIYGDNRDNIIAGMGGNDTLYGGAGNDTLDGGAGNDTLYGSDVVYSYNRWNGQTYVTGISDTSNGNDIYLFGIGFGQDVIIDNDATPGNLDTILLNAEISTSDVMLRRSDDDLVLSINDTDDALTVKNWFKNESPESQVEQIQFSDGTIWDINDIKHLVIQGTPGNDILIGYASDDVIEGLSGNDTIYGGAGSDSIQGGDDNDVLYGGTGDDILNGGAGNDTLAGGNVIEYNGYFDVPNGNDTYIFGRGYGQDTIIDCDFTPGNIDTLILEPDVIYADVTLRRSYADLILSINDTNDTVTINNWFDAKNQVEQIQFAGGTIWDVDTIKQMVLQGTPKDDILIGYSSDDAIQGLAGNDTIYGGSGNDTLDGGPGDDRLDGGDGINTFVFGLGYGKDVASGYDSSESDIVLLNPDVSPGDIILKGGGDSVYININGTDDSLKMIGWFGSTGPTPGTIEFADGTVWDSAEISSVLNTPTGSNDRIYGTAGNDIIDGGGGNDTIYGQGGDDILYGGSGLDRLYADTGNDYLYGGEDRDWLYGSSDGCTFFDGGPGDIDFIYSYGKSTYFMDHGSGGDSVVSRKDWWNDAIGDTVIFGDGITPSDLSVQTGIYYNSSYTLYTLAIGIGNDDAIFFDFDDDPESHTLADFSLNVIFANGTELSTDQILALASDGVAGYQEGSDANEIIIGSVGQDWIYCYGGDDQVIARDSIDSVYGGDGNDIIDGGSGADDVHGEAGNDILAGGNNIENSEEWDVIFGNEGSDVYVFNIGDGLHFINNQHDPLSGDVDTLSFGVGVEPSDISVYVGENGSLMFSIDGSNDSVELYKWFDPNNAYTECGERMLSRVQFVDAGGQIRVFDLAGLVTDRKEAVLAAGAGNPMALFADAFDFELTGSVSPAGGDYAVAYAQTGDLFGVPTYFTGGTGDDVINGSPGDDTIDGGDGNNTINAGDGNNTVTTGSGDDVIITGSGDDFINAGPGNDLVQGGSGDDTYRFNLGDGVDTITDTSSPSEPNALIFGPGIFPSDLQLSRDRQAEYLIFNVGSKGDAVHLSGFDPSDPYGAHAVEYYQFSSGEILTYDQLIGRGFDITGTADDDRLIGTEAMDRMTGQEGNDTFWSGPGDDTMAGGSGDDTYTYNRGDGIDIIDDAAVPGAGNTLRFGADISLADMQNKLTYQDGMFIIRLDNGDEIHLTGMDPDAADTGPHAIDTYLFADGTVLNYEQLVQNTFIFQGDENDNLITGTNLEDRLYGYEGFDRLEGGLGNDTLTGGTGDDELVGGAGSDTYVFHLGDGVDTVYDSAGTKRENMLYLPESVRADLSTSFEGDTLIVAVGTGGDAIRFPNVDSDDVMGTAPFSEIEFGDGTTITFAQLMNLGDIIGTPGDDVLTGTASDDRIFGLAGNDILDGGAGADTLIGGSGNDILRGGDGNDFYVYGKGSGNDTVVNYNDSGTDTGYDTVQFQEGLSPDSLDFIKFNNDQDLYVRIKDTGETLKIDKWFKGSNYQVDRFLFADGSSMTSAQISSRLVNGIRGSEGKDILVGRPLTSNFISGLGGNDLITGGAKSDTLDGGSGNDALTGLVGNDVLDGGTGNDLLTGGIGSDTYVFANGDGTDVVIDIGINPADQDMILFKDDVLKATIALYRSGSDLVIGYGDTDTITVIGRHTTFTGVEKVQLTSGQYLTHADINQVIQSISAFAASQGIVVTSVNDVRNNPDLMAIVNSAWQG